jgi:hypothetical protein
MTVAVLLLRIAVHHLFFALARSALTCPLASLFHPRTRRGTSMRHQARKHSSSRDLQLPLAAIMAGIMKLFILIAIVFVFITSIRTATLTLIVFITLIGTFCMHRAVVVGSNFSLWIRYIVIVLL